MKPATATIAIERVGPDRVDDMAPLYQALAEHHRALAPDLGGMPARDGAAAWARRRGRYLDWLGRPGGFALLASTAAGEAVGLAVVTTEEGYDSWDSGTGVGEVQDLAVAPAHRGAGIGACLLEAVCRELSEAGIERYRLDVLAGNDDAVRIYERQGLSTVTTQMLGSTAPRD